jgi:hypothetical protein
MTVPYEYGDNGVLTYDGVANGVGASFNLSAATSLLRLANGTYSARDPGEQALWYIASTYNGSYKYADLNANGSIDSGDATIILKVVVGNALTPDEQTRYNAFLNQCLFNETNNAYVNITQSNVNAAALVQQYGYVAKGPRRSIGSMAGLSYPGISSDATSLAPTGPPISVGAYSGIGASRGISYNNTSYNSSAANLFDTLYGLGTLGKSDSTTTTLIQTKYNFDTAPVTYWYRKTNSGQSEGLSEFTIWWLGVNIAPPLGSVLGTYPNQYYSNYQSYTSGAITYQRGLLQKSTTDKFGVTSAYYQVIYNLVIDTY